MEDIKNILQLIVEKHATEAFIVAGKPLAIRKDSDIETVENIRLMPSDTESAVIELYRLAGQKYNAAKMSDEFSVSVPGLARFRIAMYRQRGSLAAVIRTVHFGAPDSSKYNIPEDVMRLSDFQSGLIIITGPAKSGKNTTVSCMLENINNTQSKHIVTIEDPIEVLHQNKKSLFSQKEIRSDAEDYASAIRASIRQSADIIYIDKLLDIDSLKAAMEAVESNYLVITTMTTPRSYDVIVRLINMYSDNEHDWARLQVARNLKAIVNQRLIRKEENRYCKYNIANIDDDIQELIINDDKSKLKELIYN